MQVMVSESVRLDMCSVSRDADIGLSYPDSFTMLSRLWVTDVIVMVLSDAVSVSWHDVVAVRNGPGMVVRCRWARVVLLPADRVNNSVAMVMERVCFIDKRVLVAGHRDRDIVL